MSVINRVYFRNNNTIIINMGCIGKYMSKLSLPQYGLKIIRYNNSSPLNFTHLVQVNY
jgi:hypothetical protein